MATLPLIEIRRIAAEIAVDPRSVQAELDGRRVRGLAGDRIRRALAARGITPAASALPSHASAAMATGRALAGRVRGPF